uniref:IRS-type PTB domain-containing protein n=1 Tax=Syphacia muris TaxID=451379 RepID=A0A0N5AZG3_9BILA
MLTVIDDCSKSPTVQPQGFIPSPLTSAIVIICVCDLDFHADGTEIKYCYRKFPIDSAQDGGKEYLKSVKNSTVGNTVLDEPDSFFVYVKKKHKYVAGVLKVTNKEILFFHDVNNVECWPFQYLRRYGFTSGGVFFFESGRRCSTGEGLHTFQTCQSGTIFQLLQSRIQNSAIANLTSNDSAGQSIVDNIRNACLYRNNRAAASSHIHLLQRYFSEGINGTDEVYRTLHRHFYRNCNSNVQPENKQQDAFESNQERSELLTSVAFKNKSNDDFVSLGSANQHSYANSNVGFSLLSRSQDDVNVPEFDEPNGYMSETENPSSLSKFNYLISEHCFLGRYVNVCELTISPHRAREGTAAAPTLDYSCMNVPQPALLMKGSRPLITEASTSHTTCPVNAVDYSEVDLEKTHAAEIAMKAQKLENF